MSTVDLFTWREEADACAAVLAAHEVWEVARNRYQFSPVGKKLQRLAALQAAQTELLKAQVALRQVQDQGRPT